MVQPRDGVRSSVFAPTSFGTRPPHDTAPPLNAPRGKASSTTGSVADTVLQHIEADEAAQKVAEISKENARMVQAAAIAEKLASQSDIERSKVAAELYKQELPPRVKALLLCNMGMNSLRIWCSRNPSPKEIRKGPPMHGRLQWSDMIIIAINLYV
jgi:hypothetical protein